MTFQEWLKTEAGRMVSFEKMPRMLEIVWKASAEAAEAERDEAMEFSRGKQVIIDEQRRQLTEAQRAIDVLSNTVVAQDNEIKRLRQKREDVEQYRAEIERLNQAATA